jgi:bacteriocin biosynthesis cyclodehydratase domain-containing protein
MVLKVRTGVPLVWRSPRSLQFGVDTPLVVLDDLDDGAERLVSALVGGISRSGLDMMARTLGVDAVELLARLAPVLEPVLGPVLEPVLEPELEPAVMPAVVVTGSGPLADELRTMLRQQGVLAESGQLPELVAVVADWVIAPDDHGRWLRRDVPHLPVVVGDRGVTIGPLVEPGSGPCLYCVQLTRTDSDPAWPAIASQLWGRPAPPLSRIALGEAAARTAREIQARLTAESPGRGAAATSLHLDARDGAVSSRVWRPHAACRCAAPAESDWAPAVEPASPSVTTRAATAAVPA